MTIEFNPSAQEEIRQAYGWYAERDSNVAQRFVDALDSALRDVAEWPLSGSPWLDDSRFRHVAVRGFPYRLAYEVTEDGGLWVLACAHERRRPGYWTDRG